MKDALRTAITGQDNRSVDMGRLLWAFTITCLCVFEGVAVCLRGTFDPMTFSTGAATLLAGGGVGIAVKAHTEPKGDPV